MEHHTLYAALNQKAGFEKVGDTLGENQLRVIGRVPQVNVPTYREVMRYLNIASMDAEWNVDTSKQYFVRETEKGQYKDLYGWRLIFQAEDIIQYIPQIIEVVTSVPTQRRTVNEVPIQRSSSRVRMSDTGKGAGNIKGDAGVPPIVAAKMGIRTG